MTPETNLLIIKEGDKVLFQLLTDDYRLDHCTIHNVLNERRYVIDNIIRSNLTAEMAYVICRNSENHIETEHVLTITFTEKLK